MWNHRTRFTWPFCDFLHVYVCLLCVSVFSINSISLNPVTLYNAMFVCFPVAATILVFPRVVDLRFQTVSKIARHSVSQRTNDISEHSPSNRADEIAKHYSTNNKRDRIRRVRLGNEKTDWWKSPHSDRGKKTRRASSGWCYV